MRTTHLVLGSLLLIACGGAPEPPATQDAAPEPEVEPTPMSCRYLAYVIDDYLDTFEFTVAQVSGHLFSGEAIGFLYFPGFEQNLAWLHLGPLIQECSRPMSYDESCFESENHCATVECTGAGAGWAVHTRLPGQFDQNGWVYDAGETHTVWTDGTQHMDFTLSATATGPAGDDWSIDGGGEIDADHFSIDLTIADPLRTGEARLTAGWSATGGYTGAITVDGVEVAFIDPSSDHGLELVRRDGVCLW